MRYAPRPWIAVVVAIATMAAADADSRLIDAVKSGNRESVRTLLSKRVDVNAPEVDGTTALHWAVRADDLETVRMLLRAGADAKATNRYGVAPLSLAAVNGRAAMIEMLLKAGADANAAPPEGETALMTAARTGKTVPVQTLLAHGADVNARERWLGETALMWAAAENHPEVVKLLVEHDADLNARSNPLEFPKYTFNGSTMVSTPLPRGGLTPLMFAAREGALEGTRALIEAGADLNLTDRDGTSALVMAVINRHNDIAALLVEKGADPNVADAAGMTALYAAIDMHNLGRLINRPTPKPTGNLDSVDLARMLLEHGANPNARLRTPILPRFHNGGDVLLGEGATPLMRAARSIDLAMMRLLLNQGADPSLMTKTYTTALMFAAGLGGRAGTTEADAIEAIALCLEQGADINAFNNAGLTALHIAVERGDDLVKFLVERGADPDLQDKDGRTPLDVALGVPTGGFQGRRRATPGPVRESTAALLRRLTSGDPAKDARQPR